MVTYVYQLVDGEVSPLTQTSYPPCLRCSAINSGNTSYGICTRQALTDEQVKVDKVEYRRPDPPKESAQNPPATSPVPTGW